MGITTVGSFAELARIIRRDMKAKEAKVAKGLRNAAAGGRGIIKRNVPVAFGEIRESAHTEGSKVVVDAPHAAAVNNGSRPHWPPLAPLIEWVKLRGMQGLRSERQRGRLPGTTTEKQARHVSYQLFLMERDGALDVDAPKKIARAIQAVIAKRGTKPHHFMEKSLPAIWSLAREELRRAMADSPDE